jgi:hypothetical protein
MLASITPLGERARQMSWAVTATAYVLGSLAAGAAVGGALGVAGLLLARAGLDGRAAAAVLLVLLGGGIAAELAGRRLPSPRRQVDERWLGRYRGWAYGAGFGLQLGAGVTTIVSTAALYAALAAALLGGSAWGGLAVGACFGGLRGLSLLPAGRIQHAEQLVTLDARLRRWDGGARRAALAVQVAVAAALGAVLL